MLEISDDLYESWPSRDFARQSCLCNIVCKVEALRLAHCASTVIVESVLVLEYHSFT